MEINDEKIFYQDKAVVVSQSRFTAQGRTYAMRNISSVMLFHKVKGRLAEIVLLLIGGFCLIGKSWGAGLFFLGIGILIFILRKDGYSVRISSNSGETDGLESTNRQYIQTIVDALNEAIVFRG